EKPAFFALLSKDIVISLFSFDGQYSWNHLVPLPLALATSSILVLDAVLMIYGTDSPAAVEASSPSGLKIRWTPTGAIATGKGNSLPSTFVDRSGRLLVFTSRLGT